MTPRLAAAALLAGALAAPQQAAAQAEHAAVVATVQELFDAMARRDSIAMRRLLTEEGFVCATSADAAGPPRAVVHRDFIAQIAGASERLLERMWEPEVRIDGPVAMLWARYDFHRDGVFSHCGVDAVALVRVPDGWRISGITYSFQRQGCPPSPLGPPASGR